LQAFPENGQRVGLQYLSAVTGIDQETIENEIEPWLMTLKKLNRTSKGRELVA
jgi:Holliday junction resolvasome RuvABC ATP-dependent DNA helicase subunit